MLRIAVELTVRWASALPIRRALALQSFGAHGLGKPGAKAMLEGPENRDIVIDLAGIPHVLMTKELEDDLAKTMLTLPGRRGTTASSVEVPTIGNLLTARLRFPRVGGLNPDAGSAEVSLSSGPLRFREEFKLRSMVYEGRLEL